jgi:YaiO family outer membrane protein
MTNLTPYRFKAIFLAVISLVSVAAKAQHDSLQNTVSFSYEHTHFDRQFANDWRVASLEYKRKLGMGTVLGRVNSASRFGKQGWQGEVEAYPVISKKVYAYTGVSYASTVPVFANWRAGTSLYMNVAKSWEAEAGFRYLYFDQSIWMGAVGVSRYAGAWLLNARSFFSVQSPAENQSFFLKIQRFLKNEKDYVWLQAGSGVSPDEGRSIQLNTSARLSSKRITAGAKLSLQHRMQLLVSAGYAKDEYRLKTFGNQFSGSAGVSFQF